MARWLYMNFLYVVLLIVSAVAMETEVARVARQVKERKAVLLDFRKMVTNGNKCRLRDYTCFSQEVKSLIKGQTEDIIEARLLLDPFYERSVKEGFPPCSDACLNTLKAQHVDLFLNYISTYNTLEKKNYRVAPFPTVAATKIRAYMDLSAFQRSRDNGQYLSLLIDEIKFDKVTVPDLRKKEVFTSRLDLITSGELFRNSVLCHLSKGDLVYDEIMKKAEGGKELDKNYAIWLGEFEAVGAQKCTDRTPLDYRGTDSSTRRHYNSIRDRKMAEIDCKSGDFACVRKHFRGLTIRYADDVEKVSTFMDEFVKKSRPDKCDDICEAQLFVKTIQTWVTYLSKYDRKKLASTMDWEVFPEAKYYTLTEDVDLYTTMKNVFSPMLEKFGKLDAGRLGDEGLKSEVRSIGKDLSDLSSARMLKDSVICTMDPWKAEYDKYMLPYENGARNKKFEKAFVEFKENICK